MPACLTAAFPSPLRNFLRRAVANARRLCGVINLFGPQVGRAGNGAQHARHPARDQRIATGLTFTCVEPL